MKRVWVERSVLLLVIAGLVGLAFVFGILAAILVMLGLLGALALIILIGAGVSPPPDDKKFN